MGRYQPAKVNPELKQYYVLSNFSGGINTNSSDEVMQDYEFRALINVDLAKEGRLEKRKGWGYDNIITRLIEEGTPANILSNLFGDIIHVELIKDTYGTISSYRTWDALPTQYDIRLLVLMYYEANDAMIYGEFYELVLNNTGNETNLVSPSFVVTAVSNYDPSAYTSKKTPLKTTRYKERIYFLSSEISLGFPGLVYYDIGKRTVIHMAVDTNSVYKPIPQEVVNVGFNLLSPDPLQSIASFEGSSAGIYALYMTDQAGSEVYEKIPSNKQFVLNILTTGTFTKSDMDACFTDTAFAYSVIGEPEGSDNLQPISYTATYLSNAGGLFRYLITFKETLSETRLVYVNLSTASSASIATYADKNAIQTAFAWVTNGDVGRAFLLDNNDAYLKNETSLQHLGSVATITGSPTSYGWYRNSGENHIYYYDGQDTYYPTYQLIQDPSDLDYVFSGVTVPVIGGSYYASATPELWTVTMASGAVFLISGGATDTYSLSASYFAAPAVNVPKLEGITGSFYEKAQLTKAGDRLLMYGDNAIFWSEFGNWDYFPNPNYVILPLESDDVITNISYFRGSYLVFTKKSIWRITGEFGDIESFSITLLNDSIGCVAPKSVKGFENTVIFMSADGLYRVKQAYFTEGLENVEKVDKHVKELVEIDSEAEAILYGEQYWLFSDKWKDYDAIRYYYTIDIPNGHPYVVDSYGSHDNNKPDAIFQIGNKLFSIKGKTFYQYGIDYYDFLPNVETPFDDELTNATYTTTIVTSNNSFGYPTHTKKMKSMYIKTDAKTAVPFYISIALDNETDDTLTTEDMVPMLDPTTGSITYVQVETPNLTLIGQAMDPSALLDYFILNQDILNSNTPTQLVKLPFSGKGRNVKVMIKQKSADYFAIENIGFLFKLGKVRENRR